MEQQGQAAPGSVLRVRSAPHLKVRMPTAPTPERARGDDLYERLLNGLYDAVVITDFEGRLVDHNLRAEEITGCSRMELRRRTIEDIIPGLGEALLARIRQQVECGGHAVMEAFCRRRDGLMQPVEVAVSRLDLTDGGELCFAVRKTMHRRQELENMRRAAEEAIRRARSDDGFSGRLDVLALTDVIQLIDSAGKTGTLEVLDQAQELISALAFDGGRIVHAVCGEKTGEEGVYGALRKGGASFRFRGGSPSERDATIKAGTMSLILEGARRMDEADLAGEVAAVPGTGETGG